MDLRGTVVADKNGHYRFQCPFPSAFSGGPPPHIHMAITADAFLPIETEVFPTREAPRAHSTSSWT